MARVERMVTRTIYTNKLNVKVADLNENVIKEIEILVPRQNSEKAFKGIIERICEEKGCKYLATISDETVATLYGMTEQAFLEHAKALPPRSVNDEAGEEA